MKKVIGVLLIAISTTMIVGCGNDKGEINKQIEEQEQMKNEALDLNYETVQVMSKDEIVNLMTNITNKFKEIFKDSEIKSENNFEDFQVSEDLFTVADKEKTVELNFMDVKESTVPSLKVTIPVTIEDINEGRITKLEKFELDKYNEIFGIEWNLDYSKANKEMKDTYKNMKPNSIQKVGSGDVKKGYTKGFTFYPDKIVYKIIAPAYFIEE